MNEKSAVLLDTCALIWLANGDALQDAAMAKIIAAALTNSLLISTVSAWEIGMLSKPKAGRVMEFLPDPKTWFARVMARTGVRMAPLTPEIAIAAAWLPDPLHGDPADRLLIATARDLAVPMITRDAKILDYARQGHIQAVLC
jgi:PIN domain nuclease of toxin-antitoxin system